MINRLDWKHLQAWLLSVSMSPTTLDMEESMMELPEQVYHHKKEDPISRKVRGSENEKIWCARERDLNV